MSHPNKVNPYFWSQAQSADAAQLWQNLFVDYHGDGDPYTRDLAEPRRRVLHLIAKAIGKSFDSADHRLMTKGASFGTNQRAQSYAPADKIADAASRREAGYRASLTAQVFGDPPPGYSALDKRQQGARR